MKIRLLIAFVLLASFAAAQDFEGTIRWSMKMDITDPKLKAQMEEAEKKMKDPATQAQMKQMMEQMNSPEMKKMMESNPQMKAQMEAALKMMQGGGSMMPTGMTIKTKTGNALMKIEGGPMPMETLVLKDKNESYLINHEAKTYSVLPKNESSPSTHDPAVTVKKTSETQKILNYNCTKSIVTVTEGGQTITQTFWTTNEIKGLDFKSMANQNMGKGKEAMYYKDLEGVPLKVEMTIPQGTMVMQVIEIKKESLSNSDFQLPAGFTEAKLPGH
jgi:GLPGLI family protein